MINKLQEEKSQLLNLADNMASAATSFNSHGYSIFIEARERYIAEVSKIIDELITLVVH